MTSQNTQIKNNEETIIGINNIDGKSVCTILMMSKVDINDCQDDFKEILLGNCCFVDKDMPLNEMMYNQISDDDINLLLGEYIANFLIPSWMKQMMK